MKQSRTGRIIRNFVDEDVTPLVAVMQNVIDGIRQNDISKGVTCRCINTQMFVHHVYRERHAIN